MFLKLASIALLLVYIKAEDYCKLKCGTDINTICLRKDVSCKLASKCGKNGKAISFSEEDRQLIAKLHNELRSKVAMGKQSGQPKAANMKKMVYNKDLETVAQCWANACEVNPLKHDKCRRIKTFEYVGQNIYLGPIPVNKKQASSELLTDGVKAWFSEVSNFKPDWVKNDAWQKNMNLFMKVGHYTQLTWAETGEVGCGATIVDTNNKDFNSVVLVCNYGPGGNGPLPVYIPGEPASKCPKGYKPEKSTGLCAK